MGVGVASSPTIEASAGAELSVPIHATGGRDATVVVQAYLSGPAKVLGGFAKAVVAAGEDQVVPAEAFRRWDGRWVVDRGRWNVVLGASATDIRMQLELEVT